MDPGPSPRIDTTFSSLFHPVIRRNGVQRADRIYPGHNTGRRMAEVQQSVGALVSNAVQNCMARLALEEGRETSPVGPEEHVLRIKLTRDKVLSHFNPHKRA